MTRDEIIKLAREADFGFYDGRDAGGIPRDSLVGMRAITRFANLIEQRAAAAEREACAQIAEEWFARVVAATIRARGEKNE